MATVYSIAGYDGYIYRTSPSSWAAARDTADGQGIGRTVKKANFGISASRFSARGGGYNWKVYRTFLRFDTSGISEAPSSATLKVYGYGYGAADFFAVQSNHSAEFLVGDYDAIEGWSSGADNEGNVTKLSSEYDVSGGWSTSGYNDITLNATALTQMADLDNFKICLIESVHDLRNVEPTSAFRTGLYYSDNTGTSNDPYIDYAVATAATDNATFFGCNF